MQGTFYQEFPASLAHQRDGTGGGIVTVLRRNDSEARQVHVGGCGGIGQPCRRTDQQRLDESRICSGNGT